ncbi:hypothetical protein [Streptomyces sp. NPDC051636]|uniref:hypothetical protein n=1 Tax=Streptomyces sp. NPDC051636 TaxID=3365663 RepID=UPI0037959D19
MPSRDASDALARLNALHGAGMLADTGIDPLGGFLYINCLDIEAGTEARVIH